MSERECFSAATEGFVLVVAGIGDDGWGRPALGSWSVLELVGHTSRALSTIETYLGGPRIPNSGTLPTSGPSEIAVRTPRDYLLLGRGVVDHSAVAQRGREAGVALGDDPVVAVRALVDRVTALVAATDDDAPLQMRLGATTLLAYLPTRTFELTVHTLDLTSALGIGPPAILQAPIVACLGLVAEVVGAGPEGAAVLLALTGRGTLPAGFSVV